MIQQQMINIAPKPPLTIRFLLKLAYLCNIFPLKWRPQFSHFLFISSYLSRPEVRLVKKYPYALLISKDEGTVWCFRTVVSVMYHNYSFHFSIFEDCIIGFSDILILHTRSYKNKYIASLEFKIFEITWISTQKLLFFNVLLSLLKCLAFVHDILKQIL